MYGATYTNNMLTLTSMQPTTRFCRISTKYLYRYAFCRIYIKFSIPINAANYSFLPSANILNKTFKHRQTREALRKLFIPLPLQLISAPGIVTTFTLCKEFLIAMRFLLFDIFIQVKLFTLPIKRTYFNLNSLKIFLRSKSGA